MASVRALPCNFRIHIIVFWNFHDRNHHILLKDFLLQPSSPCCLLFSLFMLEQKKPTNLLVFYLDNLSIYCLRAVQSYFLKEIPFLNNVIKTLVPFAARKRKLH